MIRNSEIKQRPIQQILVDLSPFLHSTKIFCGAECKLQENKYKLFLKQTQRNIARSLKCVTFGESLKIGFSLDGLPPLAKIATMRKRRLRKESVRLIDLNIYAGNRPFLLTGAELCPGSHFMQIADKWLETLTPSELQITADNVSLQKSYSYDNGESEIKLQRMVSSENIAFIGNFDADVLLLNLLHFKADRQAYIIDVIGQNGRVFYINKMVELILESFTSDAVVRLETRRILHDFVFICIMHGNEEYVTNGIRFSSVEKMWIAYTKELNRVAGAGAGVLDDEDNQYLLSSDGKRLNVELLKTLLDSFLGQNERVSSQLDLHHFDGESQGFHENNENWKNDFWSLVFWNYWMLADLACPDLLQTLSQRSCFSNITPRNCLPTLTPENSDENSCRWWSPSPNPFPKRPYIDDLRNIEPNKEENKEENNTKNDFDPTYNKLAHKNSLLYHHSLIPFLIASGSNESDDFFMGSLPNHLKPLALHYNQRQRQQQQQNLQTVNETCLLLLEKLEDLNESIESYDHLMHRQK